MAEPMLHILGALIPLSSMVNWFCGRDACSKICLTRDDDETKDMSVYKIKTIFIDAFNLCLLILSNRAFEMGE